VAWSGEFLTKIAGEYINPIYVLETAQIGGIGAVGGLMTISSAPIADSPIHQPILSPQGSRVSGTSVNVTDWTFTTGEWSIGIASPYADEVRNNLVRGQGLVLKIGFPGWSFAQYQTVAVGTLANVVQGENGQWVIVVRSLLGGLATRWTTDEDEAGLFYHLPIETFVAVAYTTVAATLTVDDATGTEGLGGAEFILRVAPDDGDAFYLYCATRAADVFTVTSVLFDTTEANAAVGDADNLNVEIGALIKDDNVAKIVAKVLLSTGTATNGPHDTLPRPMGLNLAEEHFDTQNYPVIEALLASPTADDDLYAYSFDIQEDGLAWIETVLAPFGAFLCEREGQISIGVITQEGPPVNSFLVDDNDIAAISYEAWNSDQPVEYGVVKGQLPLTEDVLITSVGGDIESRPNVTEQIVNFPYVNGLAESEWMVDALARYFNFRRTVGESVVLTLRGWRLASAAPGDHIIISSARLTGRTFGGVFGTATIMSVECDWFGSSTKIRAVYLPPEAGQ
jgi:hypothetical protein